MAEQDWNDCQECVAGHGDSCARLFKRYEGDITRQMWRFTRRRPECEELVHEVFVEAYLSLVRYRPTETPFLHWLRCIATRVGYRFWKGQARRRKHLPLEEIDVADRSALESGEVGDATAAAALLHKLLARLAPPDRLVLMLMYFEECSTEQIAERAGWTRAMVKMRAMRARRKLRKIIEDEKLLELLTGVSRGSA